MSIDIEALKKALKEVAEKAMKAAKEVTDKVTKEATSTVKGATASISSANEKKMPGVPKKPLPTRPSKSIRLPLSYKDISEKTTKTAQEVADMAAKEAKVVAYGIAMLISAVIGKKIPGIPEKPPFPAKPSRPMKFPYTFTAKVMQFPWVYYIKNNWVYRYYVIAIVVSFPIFKKIHNLANSPANVKKWEEIKRKELEAQQHH